MQIALYVLDIIAILFSRALNIAHMQALLPIVVCHLSKYEYFAFLLLFDNIVILLLYICRADFEIK